MRRLRTILISWEYFRSLFEPGIHCEHYEVSKQPIPPDAKLVNARVRWEDNLLEVMIESESFDPVGDGATPPTMAPEMTTTSNHHPPLLRDM